jgi:hypothetical protein
MKSHIGAFYDYFGVLVLIACALFLMSCEDDPIIPQSGTFFQSGWQVMNSGTTVDLRDVWGVDNENVFAVGDEGTILHYDGVSWTQMNSGTTQNLRGIWGYGMQNIYAAGENGTLLFYDGTNWTPIDVGVTETLRAVGGTFYDYFVTKVYGPYMLIGGPPGKILYYNDWFNEWMTSSSGSTEELLNLHVFNTERDLLVLCAVGRSGAVYTWYGPSEWSQQTWFKSETGIADDLYAVLGDAPGYMYAVADGGNIYQNTKQWMEDPPSGVWRQTAGLGGGRFLDLAARSYNDLFIVGEGGRIVHYDRRTFTEMESKVFSTIRGVWADDMQVFAVGAHGLILTYTDPPSNSPCPINVRISVTDEVIPLITWEPECPVSKLFVEDWGGDGYGFRWFIATDGNFIDSGVRYGTVPDNALEFCPAGALLEGGLYRVSLIRRDWDTEILIGSWNIVPGNSVTNGFMAVRRSEVRGPDDWLAQVATDPAGGHSYQKLFYLLRLRQTIPGQPVYGYAGITIRADDWWRWIVDPAEREERMNIRPIIVQKLVYDPEEGISVVITREDYRAAQLNYDGEPTVIWDILKP